MSDLPEGFVPEGQFQAAEGVSSPEGFIPEDQFESHEEHYGSVGEQAKTFVEGASEGVLGPLAPMAQVGLGISKPEDMLARREENPITHGVGQAAGLVGSLAIGVGEGALMAKAGTEAAEAVGLGAQIAKEASYGFKVGSAAVTQAAEMAVLQGSDEVSKMILNDPNTSAESALANVGLAAVLGGAGGAVFAGAVNPLWEATAGPRVEQMLSGMRSHFNGNAALMPEELKVAQSTLGIEIEPELKAVLSGNPTAISHYNVLKEGQHPKFSNVLTKFDDDLSASVSQALRIAPEDIAIYSENEAGHELLNTFKKEYQSKYGPIAEALEKRNAEAAVIGVSDEARLAQYGKMLEDGMTKVGTDSPTYKLYNDWGNRLLAKETIGGIDMLKTELNGEISKAIRAADTNQLMALKDIRSSLADFQESQILKQAKGLSAEKLGKELVDERIATNAAYRDFAKMSQELSDHLGTGRFSGAGGLTNKLGEKVSAEQLLNKFSFKGNADFIPFLKQNFPEVFEKIRENELKKLIKPAVLSAKGEQPLNIKKLADIIDKGLAGQKEHIEAVIPPEAINRIMAARQLQEALPQTKSSGTAGWMTKMFSDMPRSAMAGVAMLTGHNPVIGAVLGEMAQRLGRDAPDAVRLAHLKFLASDEPIKAGGFKAMVDFFHNTYKGETMLAKAASNVFKAGAQVLTESQMPNKADREKLDKLVTKMQKDPESLIKSQEKQEVGHYLPNHQVALSASAAKAVQYLHSIKPQDHVLSPFDKPVPPQPSEIARYDRALNIATNPAVVFEHIKNGTLQRSDIQDLHNLYPALYPNMSQKLSNAMTSKHSDGELVPYKTRMGAALFLGTPVDKTMEPNSILAAQPMPKDAQPMPQPQGKTRKGTSTLGKSAPSYRTASQAAESDRSNRD